MQNVVRIIIVVAASLVTVGQAWAVDMPALAKLKQCSACHSIEKKVIGPAWMDVSKKYKGVTKYTYSGSEYPLVDGLVLKVSRGGAGNWGTMPMPPNSPVVTDADIKTLVQFILGLAN